MIENSKITPEIFDDLLYLSRLSLEKDETQSISKQVEQIVSYFDMLKKFDITDDIMRSDDSRKSDLRSDVVGAGIEPATLKKMTNEYMDGYFRVPKVLESGA